ncbi:MAG: hypothetical protein R3E10_07415 [Gemmatimonadota bacterium]
MPQRTLAEERGFVLPAALLAVVVLTIVTTAGFFAVQQESQIGASAERSTKAFYLAEQGIVDVLGSWNNAQYAAMPQWGTRQSTDTTAMGIWTVTVTKGNDQIYYLDATGTLTEGGLLYQGSSRRVGLAARMTLPDFDPRAAITTTVNVSVRGRAEVHGEDHVPPGWGGVCTGPLSDRAGVLMQDTSTMGNAGKSKVTGNPPVQEDAGIGSQTFNQFGDMDWAELVSLASKVYAGGSLNQFFPQLDVNGNCDFGDMQNWGDPENPAAPCGNYFPVIYMAGSANLQSGSRGQGILLVDGDLAVRGDFLFHGLVIVHGQYDSQGSGNRVYGAVMASNVDLDQQNAVGQSVVDFSSCAIERAILNASELNRARPLWERGWVDLSSLSGS